MKNCCFCDEIERGPNRNFAARYPEITTRIIWNDGQLFAMPCIGQLQPNHFMIVPVAHHATFREAANSIDDIDERVDAVISSLMPVMGANTTSWLVFEHGARDPKDGGCGIYHAHLHVVPMTKKLDLPALFGIEFNRTGKSLADVFDNQPIDDSYALAGYWGGSIALASLPKPLPSQFMRRKLSAALGMPEWDWRKSGREPAVFNVLSSMQCA